MGALSPLLARSYSFQQVSSRMEMENGRMKLDSLVSHKPRGTEFSSSSDPVDLVSNVITNERLAPEILDIILNRDNVRLLGQMLPVVLYTYIFLKPSTTQWSPWRRKIYVYENQYMYAPYACGAYLVQNLCLTVVCLFPLPTCWRQVHGPSPHSNP